jgi:3,4-dihydroxy 2-butanone 4-phosphate synthase/GTP cyclohydrolase II
MSISPIQEIIDEVKAGRIAVLVDDEDRENEGDLIFAADFVTPEKINFLATHGRGLICMPITREHATRLKLAPMVPDNRARHGTNFTASIEAAEGVTTGISAYDRAHTIRVAAAPNAKPEDIVHPGHVFPLIAEPGGVLMRSGHTEACVDIARLAGLNPTAVLCEIMNQDGTMARLPDLATFAKKHNLKIGTIADLIHFRSQTETLIKRVTERDIDTAFGRFKLIVYLEKMSNETHLVLVRGEMDPEVETLVRVHEPLSIVDLLETTPSLHSWTVQEALAHIAQVDRGVVVLLNCAQSAADLIERTASPPKLRQAATSRAFLTYGIGAQILRDVRVRKMRLMAKARKMPSMAGWELQVTGYIQPERAKRS